MRVLVTGARGMLGQAVVAAAHRDGDDVVALDRAALDVTERPRVIAAVAEARPDVIVHCAAFTRVDDAELEPESAMLLNEGSVANVAEAAAATGALLVYPGTDYVFDGRSNSPYSPDSATNPLSVYGRSKLAGEIAARRAGRFHVVRTSWLYGPGGKNFVTTMLKLARDGKELRVVNDQHGTPTYTPDLASMMLGLARASAPSGIYHATNRGQTTWYDFARAIFDTAGVSADLQPVASTGYPQRATRPHYSVLDCSRTYEIAGDAPEWRTSLASALRELGA